MAGETRRFHLTTFDQPTDLRAANDYKFSDADRRLIDRLLAYVVERHHHTGEIPASTPPGAPAVTLASTGGSLPAGLNVYYKYNFVDAQGQDRAPSSITTVHTANPVLIPAAPSPTLTPITGVLPPGPYVYAVSAFTDVSSHETMLSGAVTATSIPLDGGFRLTLPSLPSGATGLNIYCQGPMDTELFFLQSVTTAATYDHNGSVTRDAHRRAPNINTTASGSSAAVMPVSLPAGWTYKVYRTFDATDWASSLIGWAATTPFTDTGHAALAAGPPSATASVGSPPKILLTDNAEVTGTLPPGMVTVPTQIAFFQPGPVLVGRLPHIWVNEFARAWVTGIRIGLGRDATITAGFDSIELEYLAVGAPGWVSSPYLPVALYSGFIGDYTLPSAGLTLGPGDALAVYVEGNDTSGLQPDFDMTVTVSMNVQYGSATQTYEWET